MINNKIELSPREKAKQLSIKFTRSADVIKPNKASIEMALLCVDELLDAVPLINNTLTQDRNRRYYMDVREELKSL